MKKKSKKVSKKQKQLEELALTVIEMHVRALEREGELLREGLRNGTFRPESPWRY